MNQEYNTKVVLLWPQSYRLQGDTISKSNYRRLCWLSQYRAYGGMMMDHNEEYDFAITPNVTWLCSGVFIFK